MLVSDLRDLDQFCGMTLDTFGNFVKDQFALGVDTFGNFVKDQFALGVSQHDKYNNKHKKCLLNCMVIEVARK